MNNDQITEIRNLLGKNSLCMGRFLEYIKVYITEEQYEYLSYISFMHHQKKNKTKKDKRMFARSFKFVIENNKLFELMKKYLNEKKNENGENGENSENGETAFKTDNNLYKQIKLKMNNII